ncbi:hypothetical protein [Tatumella morbirosei]|uniref:hypothetical protein n=1 Tax=Tatumella morbirosei TaxID=642227 RepID=UPI000699569A|nr:hypothetical protein [Tatumella morbirosei]
MTNPNYIPQWPLYKDTDGIYIRALPIKSIKYANDGSGLVSFDGAYNEQYISAAFAATFNPQAGGYLFNSQYGEILYLSKTDFEAKYTADTEGQGAKGDKGDKGDTGATGAKGDTGLGIKSIAAAQASGTVTLTFTMTDGTTQTASYALPA